MIYKYELACKEAGLNKEEIAEIRKVFDTDRKKLKRENEIIEKANIQYFSIDKTVDEEGNIDSYDICDINANTEMEAIKLWEVEKLREFMNELSVEDREFLYACFDDVRGAEKRIAQRLGIPRNAVQYRKRKLIAHLRKKFMGEI